MLVALAVQDQHLVSFPSRGRNGKIAPHRQQSTRGELEQDKARSHHDLAPAVAGPPFRSSRVLESSSERFQSLHRASRVLSRVRSGGKQSFDWGQRIRVCLLPEEQGGRRTARESFSDRSWLEEEERERQRAKPVLVVNLDFGERRRRVREISLASPSSFRRKNWTLYSL